MTRQYNRIPETPMESSSSFWNRCRCNIRVTSQIYCGQETDLRRYIMDELSHKLEQELSKLGIQLEIERCESPSNIKGSMPLIVICQQCTRLGSDYNAAINGIHDGANVAVLICHHKDSYSLPAESSKNLLRGTEYKKVEAIIDTAFIAQRGWYDCKMNTKAYQELKSFFEEQTGQTVQGSCCTIL